MSWSITLFVIIGIMLIMFMLISWHNDVPKKNMNPFEEIPSNLTDLKLVEKMLVNQSIDQKRTYKKHKEHGEDISHENEVVFKKLKTKNNLQDELDKEESDIDVMLNLENESDLGK